MKLNEINRLITKEITKKMIMGLSSLLLLFENAELDSAQFFQTQ